MASVFKFLLPLQLLLARPPSIKWILLATRNFHSCLASWRAVVSHTAESIVRFKRPDNQSRNLNWKILSVMDRKLSGNVNSPFGYQYRICTRILQKYWRVLLVIFCIVIFYIVCWIKFIKLVFWQIHFKDLPPETSIWNLVMFENFWIPKQTASKKHLFDILYCSRTSCFRNWTKSAFERDTRFLYVKKMASSQKQSGSMNIGQKFRKDNGPKSIRKTMVNCFLNKKMFKMLKYMHWLLCKMSETRNLLYCSNCM